MARKATNVLFMLDHSSSMNDGPKGCWSPPRSGEQAKQETAAQALARITTRLVEYQSAHPDEVVNVGVVRFGGLGVVAEAAKARVTGLLGAEWVSWSRSQGVSAGGYAPIAQGVPEWGTCCGGTPLYSALGHALCIMDEADNLAANVAHLLIVVSDGEAGDPLLKGPVVAELQRRVALGGWTVVYVFLGTQYDLSQQLAVLELPETMVYAGLDVVKGGLLRGLEDFLAARELEQQAIDHWFSNGAPKETDQLGALDALRKETL